MLDKNQSRDSWRRKAAGPRFLLDASCDTTKDPKIAGLQVIAELHRESVATTKVWPVPGGSAAVPSRRTTRSWRGFLFSAIGR